MKWPGGYIRHPGRYAYKPHLNISAYRASYHMALGHGTSREV
jgi:hypothetical protein